MIGAVPSTLIIGSSANIKGNVKDENEITIYDVEGTLSVKNNCWKVGSAKGKIITENLVIENVDGEIKVKIT